MRNILYIITAALILTGCEFGDDYSELHDIHAALAEIEIVDTLGTPIIPDSGVCDITSDLDLPADGNYDVTFAWESNNTAVVTSGGIVNRQGVDVPVILTVTGTKGKYGQKKRFYLNVKAL
jgi:hypothetical protein